jgi:outer membrane protein OmpA-like peptidoglycan-associated protein
MSTGATSMNHNTGLVNIPTAETLEHLGYNIGVTASNTLGKEEDLIDPRFAVEEDGRFNIGFQLKSSGVLKYNFEIGITQFTLIEDENRRDGVVNFRWQLIKELGDEDWGQDFDLDANHKLRYLPSLAIGAKNIVGKGMQYITSVGPQQEFPSSAPICLEKHSTNNSLYIVTTKKLYSKPASKLQLHLGWGINAFQGEISPKDKSVGLFSGISYTIRTGNGLNPLTVMADYDGRKTGIGIMWIYNKRSLIQGKAVDGFMPGIIMALAISDIEENFRDYNEDTFFGKEMAPNIEIHIGITNDAYLKYKNYYSNSTLSAEEIRKKKYVEAIRVKAMAEAAKKEAEAKALEIKKSSSEFAKELEGIGMTVRQSATQYIVILNGVNFMGRTTDLELGSTDVLDKVVTLIKDYPEINLSIEGHTDFLGPDSANLKLSKRRTITVLNYFVTKGIGSSRLSSKGWGESSPIAPNDTIDGRAMNRRIEIVFNK